MQTFTQTFSNSLTCPSITLGVSMGDPLDAWEDDWLLDWYWNFCRNQFEIDFKFSSQNLKIILCEP